RRAGSSRRGGNRRTTAAPSTTSLRAPAADSSRTKPRNGRASPPRSRSPSAPREVLPMFSHERQDRDLDDELRAYVDLLTAEKIKAGMQPDAARRAALLETGGVEQVKEEVRDLR